MAQESFPFAGPAPAGNPQAVVNSDDKYRRMARWWREDGVIDGYGDELAVTLSGFTATVRTGVAFVNGVFYENTTPLALTVPTVAAGQSRRDLVVLRLDVAARTVTAHVKPGTISAPPPLTRTAQTWEALVDQFMTISTGATPALGSRYDRWSYGDRRSGRPPGWHVGLASGTLLPRGVAVRLGITADNDQSQFAEGVRVGFGAATSGITILRDGFYDVSIQGRIEAGDSADRTVPEALVAEQQRIVGGTWTRIARVGGPDWSISSSGFLNCLAGDAIVPYAYQNHPTGTWRLTNRLNEALFSGAWRRDYGGA